ncbi:DUF1287 domain-containing protein [Roseibium sediminicola]|uniref:DUF1287 domain-containing protein n=1 Tax=Roseibium sediminicola TaxID=2933272 RepID=A0ABT0GZH5_9HYPH|nr:DUF1287 domain-containing protein [Roseibium sp. CAU 1639]MCK7614839.1 DUF1287 domain-containing protein [Roseibium sp. CAU 1639]
MDRRSFLFGTGLVAASLPLVRAASAEKVWQTPQPWAEKLISAAESQIGVTLIYDPAYTGLGFPNGDVPRERGVCTDVIVRAYRDAFGFDLQREVNADMKAHFSRYPKIWGLKGPDRNIDHRRVPNLQTFFERRNAALPVSDRAGDYVPGDLVSQMLPGNLPHIAIVTHRRSADGERPMLVHNIGAGTRLEDRLFDFKITSHYRFQPA